MFLFSMPRQFPNPGTWWPWIRFSKYPQLKQETSASRFLNRCQQEAEAGTPPGGYSVVDRFLVAAAFHIVASRHHSGQNSKGYANLSQLARMGYNPGLASWASENWSEERQEAARLIAMRRREIRLEW
jgi:hypothetical protein